MAQLSDLFKGNTSDVLQKLRDNLQIEEDRRQEIIHNQELEFKNKYLFKGPEELINYILSGNPVHSRWGYAKEGLYLEDDHIKQIYMQYNDIDMPIGLSTKYYSIEEFTERAKDFMSDNDGFIFGWIKTSIESEQELF